MTDDPKRIVLSWSRLADFETCGQRVKLIREGNKGQKNGRIFLHGTVADRCTRRYLELDDPQPGHLLDPLDELLDYYIHDDDEYVIRWIGDPNEDKARVRAKIVRVLEGLEPILWEKVIPFGYQAEVKFRVTIGVPYLDGSIVPIDLIGGMDILTKTLDGTENYSVYDLKATEDDSYVRGKTLAQLIFYAIAVKAMFGKYPIETAFLTPACKEKIVAVNVTQQDVREMIARIIKYCNAVWREEFKPRDTLDDECWNCLVKHACSLYRLPTGRTMSWDEMTARRYSKKEEK